MHLNCPHCRKLLKLAADKFPAGQRVKLVCPQCAKSFVIEPEQQTAPNNLPSLEPDPLPQASDLEFYPPGAKVAFLFVRDPDWVASLTHCLKERGYHVAVSDNHADAFRRIDSVGYHLLLFEQTPEALGLLGHIHTWAGIQRRSVNVILIGEDSASLHPQAAFRHGVNCYFNHADSQNAQWLVQSAIDGYDEFYKVWRLAAQTLSKVHV
ncbi:hypothetical protein [Desulfonatronum sp. SC1]|uniref:hypothetical protein n=1 Tax=Desulfonatronum sp. SC1 TaxID=2109626 RepID=UPI000D30ADC8|nr:hypothetical protein [Desulfonatronum sp. SC1]PTN38038.1 hypothetical protein C6366_04020 [Desulfonatronum sp. SC1]